MRIVLLPLTWSQQNLQYTHTCALHTEKFNSDHVSTKCGKLFNFNEKWGQSHGACTLHSFRCFILFVGRFAPFANMPTPLVHYKPFSCFFLTWSHEQDSLAVILFPSEWTNADYQFYRICADKSNILPSVAVKFSLWVSTVTWNDRPFVRIDRNTMNTSTDTERIPTHTRKLLKTCECISRGR